MLSKTTLVARPGSSLIRRFVLETIYPILLQNSRSPTASWKIPAADAVEVGLTYET